ncbi:MAG: glycine cleavage system protein GcvH [Bacillota bacterium]
MKDFYFLPTHEWFNKQESTIGLSESAQKELGDIVFVELPEVGDKIEKGQPFANVESVKAVSEVYAPVSGEIVEINEEILDNPEKINQDAFSSWLVKVSKAEGVEELMSYDDYIKTKE